MKFIHQNFAVSGFTLIELDQVIIDYLWKIIHKGTLAKKDHKPNIVANISESYEISDENDFFMKNVCIPLIKAYQKTNKGLDPVNQNTLPKPNTRFVLDGLWVNYQYQHEMNPYHHHSGVYSFAIWMKIPYESNKLSDLPQFKGTKKEHIKAGAFEFEFINTIGDTRNSRIPLSSSSEGKMVFFPATMRHCVYPFYGTDEARISVAGNIWYGD